LIAIQETGAITPLEIGQPAIELEKPVPPAAVVIDIRSPLSSFHYQVEKVCPDQQGETILMFIVCTDLALAVLREPRAQRLQNVHIFVHMGAVT
jgi:hypothetical protein